VDFHTPTVEEVNIARRLRTQRENRASFYYWASEQIGRAIRDRSWPRVAEALGVVLKTWNKNYYRFYARFGEEHIQDITDLLTSCASTIESFRQQSIDTFSDPDGPTVVDLFQSFEGVVGTVGAAKCFHLLAPAFFPLWDTRIAKGYRPRLQRRGKNGSLYCELIRIAQANTRPWVESKPSDRIPSRPSMSAITSSPKGTPDRTTALV
jgi:hypothetical protein